MGDRKKYNMTDVNRLSLLSTTHWSAVLSAAMANIAWSRNSITSIHRCNSTDTSISTSTSPSQASHQKNDHSPPSPSRTSATHHTSYNASSAKLKSRYSTQHQTRFKHHYKHTCKDKQDTQDKAGVYRIPCFPTDVHVSKNKQIKILLKIYT